LANRKIKIKNIIKSSDHQEKKNLQVAEIQLDALERLLPTPVRPRPDAVAVLVPLPALVLRRVPGAQHGRAAEPAVGAGQRPQRGARGHAQRVP